MSICEQYIKIRFACAGELYQNEWRKRFKDGQEWNRSDMTGRMLLQKLDADKYPKSLSSIQKGA